MGQVQRIGMENVKIGERLVQIIGTENVKIGENWDGCKELGQKM